MKTKVINLKQFKSYNVIIDEWIKIGSLTYYQKQEWINLNFDIYNKNLISKLRNRVLFVALFDENLNLRIIAPILYTKYGTKNIYLLGSGQGNDYQDFLYAPDVGFNEFDFLFDAFKLLIGDYVFNFELLHKESKLLEYLLFKNRNLSIKTNPCVSIKISSYDKYYETLSKNFKQNIRTSYNRMNTDGVIFSFEKIAIDKIRNEDKLNLINIYKTRNKEKNNKDKFTLKISKLIKALFVKDIYQHLFFFKLNFVDVLILRINGNIAAYALIINEITKGIYRIPRIVLNSEFKRYSPGIVLLLSWIKSLSNNSYVNEFQIDLTNGDEYYKYALGGMTTYSYSGVAILS